MGSGGITRAGQTRRFCRYWFGCIKTGEQALTSRLARHAHEGDKIIGSCARDAAFGDAPVAVSVEDVPFIVHGDFVKIEQIAVLMTATLLPDARNALHGIVGCGVKRRPRCAAIDVCGDELVLFTM